MSSALTVCGVHDDNTLEQMAGVMRTARYGVLCADGHYGYVMPIGGVAAYRNKVSPTGAGFDIACGNAAIKTTIPGSALHAYGSPERAALAKEVYRLLEFGIGRKNKDETAPTDIPVLGDDPRWEAITDKDIRETLKDKARDQIGTIGSGNHYLDVFTDESDNVWIGVHCGSRGLGHTIASGFMALSQNQPWGKRVPEVECLLDLDSPLGDAYWNMMELAGEYAYASREWIVRRALRFLGGEELEMIHNHHNFCWRETHFGEEFVVVRKGSTPAFPGQRSFVGGSMGDDSVILEGLSTDWNASLLASTVHGAGRVMSRTKAAGKKDWKTGGRKTGGEISHEMMRDWLRERQVTLAGGDVDESPHVYRRLPEVLEAQGRSVKIVHTLTPRIVCMAGGNEFDPFKD